MKCTVTICFIFIFISSVSGSLQYDYSVSEVHEMKRKECWEHGGVGYNHYDANNIGQFFLAMKTNKTTVLNFGMQFSYNGDDFVTTSNLKNDIEAAAHYLKLATEQLSWSKKTGAKQKCQRVLDYKCLQDITINTGHSLQKFNEMKCVELKKDLVIDGLDVNGPNIFEVFQNIQKIHGRLIIRNVHTEGQLSFKELTEVGGYGENKNLPNIQIHGNVMRSIRFPKIFMNKCKPTLKRNCVSVEDNWNIDNLEEPLRIQFKNSQRAVHRSTPYEVISAEPGSEMWLKEKERLEKDPSLVKAEYNPKVMNWTKDGFGEDASIILAVPAFLILAGLIGYVVWFFKVYWPNYETYDFEAIEREDEKEGPNFSEDYFKVDGNKEKDRDSGMDDLGSN